MNLDLEKGIELIQRIDTAASDVQIIVFPPSLFVSDLSNVAGKKCIVGVQNFYTKDSGAFTGEVSIAQVKVAGASIGLIGHSERRGLFSEDNGLLKEKVDAAIANDFRFIFCCGEPLEVREAGDERKFVQQQLNESLFHLSAEQMTNRIIAYEPIWAIGTGRTASTQQAEDVHKEIRAMLAERYDAQTASSVSILYGGSCKPSNAKELFACPNVDGGLIGGASLDAEAFSAIIESF